MEDKFEDLFDQYKNISKKLENKDITLDEALKLYEESDVIYSKLNEQIENAKIKINNIRDKHV
ncbi:exodeoxyribonuclease VII small subunit [Helcococcus kunzii]|uniref:exodeoxyribonuclease VII small subunit n=1 Tax=Helcococcus kunzii TaxID=40091 RepID=UPI0024AE1690|nr:exodeoxyribonuclease VII small subunit [Helcococcus kunzii]